MVQAHKIGFVLLLLISRGSLLGQASTQPEADREAVAKRLERLNRVRVEYSVVYHNTTVAEGQSISRPKGTIRLSSVPNDFGKQITFTYYKGFARWDSVLSESTRKWAAKNQVAMPDLLSETFEGGLRQELKQMGGRWSGALWAGDTVARWWPVELGLGLCLSEGSREGPKWITPSHISKMESRITNGGNLVLAYPDASGQRYEWEFDRRKAHALVGYTRSLGKRLIVRVTPTDFRDVDGLILPSTIQMDYLDDNGVVGTNFTATISKYNLGIEKAPLIIFPVGTTIVDTRTNTRVMIK